MTSSSVGIDKRRELGLDSWPVHLAYVDLREKREVLCSRLKKVKGVRRFEKVAEGNYPIDDVTCNFEEET